MTEKKKRVYLSKKKNLNKKKRYPTYRPMKNVPCFRKQDNFFLWPLELFHYLTDHNPSKLDMRGEYLVVGQVSFTLYLDHNRPYKITIGLKVDRKCALRTAAKQLSAEIQSFKAKILRSE